jgi:hypothetical protein
LQTSLDKRFAHGFGLSTNFTYGHAIDNAPCRGGCKPGNTAGPFPLSSTNLRLDRSNSDLDLRLRWIVMATYAPSFHWNGNRFTGALVNNWQFNGILDIQTGATFTVENSSARANTGSGDRPNLVGNPYDIKRSINEWFDVNAFAPQPLYTLGNVGRNSMYGPPLKQLDLSAFKDIKLRETKSLQLRAEFFNILNHPNFGLPGVDLGTSTFGVISDTGNYLSRNVQFAAKFVF